MSGNLQNSLNFNFSQIDNNLLNGESIKIGRSSVSCKGKVVVGSKPVNMFYTMLFYTFPFIPFNMIKFCVIILFKTNIYFYFSL